MVTNITYTLSWERGIESSLIKRIVDFRTVKSNHFTSFNSDFGSASTHFYKLSNGFSLITSTFRCEKEIELIKNSVDDDLLLIGYDISNAKIKYELINNELVLSRRSLTNKTFIFSNLLQLRISPSVNATITMIWLLIDKKWLSTKLGFILPKYTNDIRSFFGLRKKFKVRDIDLKETTIIRKILNYPFEETPETIAYFEIKAIANELLSLYIKKALTASDSSSDLEVPEVVRFREIKAYVRKNIVRATPITMTELSKKFAISESSLKRLFKRYLSTTYTDFYNEERLKKAYEIICSNKSEKLQDIAQKLGYKNAGYFSKAFKKAFNFFPHEIRDKFST